MLKDTLRKIEIFMRDRDFCKCSTRLKEMGPTTYETVDNYGRSNGCDDASRHSAVLWGSNRVSKVELK